jgi:hypothetical protein
MRSRKLADGSIRDTDWQRVEYERMMGREAAARQEILARQDRNDCTCRRRTLRMTGGRGFRTVHQRHCVKYKPWMEEYLPAIDGNASAEAHARSMRDQ